MSGRIRVFNDSSGEITLGNGPAAITLHPGYGGWIDAGYAEDAERYTVGPHPALIYQTGEFDAYVAGEVVRAPLNMRPFEGFNTITGHAGRTTLYGGNYVDIISGVGSGVDRIFGLDGNDVITGGGGADVIDGGLGYDRILYKASTDLDAKAVETVSFGADGAGELDFSALDLVSRGGGAFSGTEGELRYVRTSLGWTVEFDFQGDGVGDASLRLSDRKVVLVEAGDGRLYSEGLSLIGTKAANTLSGNVGNDYLDGRGGADTLKGGLGGDTYVYRGAETIQEVANAQGGGQDRVIAYADVLLPDDVEDVTLVGGARIALGNWQPNSMYGNGHANRLSGGEGVDTLYGGLGNDTLQGGTGDDNLYGEEGSDRLDGGLGVDTMEGGSGNDTYVINAAADRVIEAVNGGIDTVEASFSFSLTGNGVENLTLIGAGNTTGTGDAGDNVLIGNSGSNAMYGGEGNDTLDGAAGEDRLVGGLGDDVYYADTDDTLVEDAGGGTDTVRFGAFNGGGGLGAGVEVERIETVDGARGTASLSLSGNEFAQTILGNAATNYLYGLAGADRLYGRDGDDLLSGGTGADLLIGGAGADTFLFNTALGSGNVDVIQDFAAADDVIQLGRGVFVGLTSSRYLTLNQFKDLSTGQVDADDRLIYNSGTGALSYDRDGSGTAYAAVQFATLSDKATITSADFFVV